MGNMPNDPPYQQGYMPSFDDDRRVTDIIRNKNPMSTSNLYGINNVKDYYDPSIYTNRKTAFGQKTHSDPKYSYPSFGGPSFQNPFTGINHLNFGSNLDNDLHSYKALTVHNGPFEVYSKPIYVYDKASKNKSPTDFGFWNNHDTTKYHTTNHLDQHLDRPQEFLNNVYKTQGIITRPKQNELDAGNYDFRKVSFPTTSNPYDFDRARISNEGFKDSELWNPGLMTTFRGFGTRVTEKPRREYFNSISLMIGRLFLCQHCFRCTQSARVMRKLSVQF